MNDSPKIPHVAWRGGRPRFEPSKTLRAQGYAGKDLRHENGEWMTAGQALDWSRTFSRELKHARLTTAPRPKPTMPVQKAPAPAPAAYPLSTLFHDWLNPEKHPDIEDLKPKTVYEYRLKAKVLETHAAEVWRAEAEALTKPICKGLYADLRRKVGLSQAVATMRVLGIALEWAIGTREGFRLLVNPAHKLKMRKPDPRVRFATPDEVRHLVATADKMGRTEVGDMIILGVWSGQRQADRLEFELTSRVDGRIIVRQNKTGVIVSLMEAPELTSRIEASAKRRAMALGELDGIVDLEEARQRRSRLARVMQRLVIDERRWAPFLKRHYNRIYTDVRTAAAVEMKSVADINDQDLRDTAVTWLAMAGATIPEICSITGHTFGSANEILKHYLARHPEMADSGLAKMIVWHEQKQAKRQADA